jgi:hypothetical protein
MSAATGGSAVAAVVAAAVASLGVAAAAVAATTAAGPSSCWRPVSVTSQGQRLDVEPSATAVMRGSCLRFVNLTRVDLRVTVGNSYAVDLPPGTLTGTRERPDFPADRLGRVVETVAVNGPGPTVDPGTGIVTVIAASPRSPRPPASPPTARSPSPAPVAGTPSSSQAAAAPGRSSHRPSPARSRTVTFPPSPTAKSPSASPPPPVLHATLRPQAVGEVSGGRDRRTRLVGVAVLLVVIAASGLVRARPPR